MCPFQIVCEGPVDLVFVPGFASNLLWTGSSLVRQFLRRLGSFCRLVVIDRRGCGLSDRLSRATSRLSSTVKDLVAGSGLLFEDQGMRVLKGVPDPVKIYRVLQ